MATYIRKSTSIEAREYEGPGKLVVISANYGEQIANKGDFLVGTEPGQVYVIARAQFLEDYEVGEAPETPEYPKTLPDGRVVVTESGKTQEELDAEVASVSK